MLKARKSGSFCERKGICQEERKDFQKAREAEVFEREERQCWRREKAVAFASGKAFASPMVRDDLKLQIFMQKETAITNC